MSTGTLYLVATPIGNLEDLTLRAISTLKAVDIIACEDTRVTANLLNHFGIKKPLVSYFEHNKSQRSQYLIDQLLAGKNTALVSNAGTPLISDPGYELVHLCITNHITINTVPGPCALVSALTLAGLPTDRFIFEGFLPRKPSKRRKRLEEIAQYNKTIIIYESPFRIIKTLIECKNILGNRQIALVREMTKIYEEVRRGKIEDVIKDISTAHIRGEIVLVIDGLSEPANPTDSQNDL